MNLACFYVTCPSVKVSNVFNTLTLKQIFWKTKTFFKKLEYRFLVEATKIEITPFPFKTALAEANVKTNRMATTKMDLSQRVELFLHFFGKLVPVLQPLEKS